MLSRRRSGSWFVVAALGGSACLQTETVLCLDGRRCPAGTVCATCEPLGPEAVVKAPADGAIILARRAA